MDIFVMMSKILQTLSGLCALFEDKGLLSSLYNRLPCATIPKKEVLQVLIDVPTSKAHITTS